MLASHRSPHSVDGASTATVLSLTMRVWISRIELDRELAEGANPTTDAARGLRARQLTSRRCRRQLASALRSLVESAYEPVRSPWVVAVPPDRRQVREARDLLLALAERLEDAADPCPRAVALASFLVSDPASPARAWFDDCEDPLSSSDRATTAQLARAALDAVDHRPLT